MSRKAEERNSGLDILRVVATLFIPGVHFFLYTDFYSAPLSGKRAFVLVFLRVVTYCGVPLFMMLTGYLQCRKKVSRRYYAGIVRVLVPYVCSFVCILLVRTFVFQESASWKVWLSRFTTFSDSYAWYIEMYIGLFLLAPFLNLCWNGLPGKKERLALIAILAGMTVLPYTLNQHGWAADGWPIRWLPTWWTGIYPLLYYFLGAYLRTDPPAIRRRTTAALTFVAAALLTGWIFLRANGGTFSTSAGTMTYSSVSVTVLTVLLFLFVSRLDVKNPRAKSVLKLLSETSLDAYLISYVFDRLLYARLAAVTLDSRKLLFWYPAIVLAVYLCSLLYALAKRQITGWIHRAMCAGRERFG